MAKISLVPHTMHELFEHFIALGVTAEDLEKEYIEFAVAFCGSIDRAAKILDIHRKTLYRKRKYLPDLVI